MQTPHCSAVCDTKAFWSAVRSPGFASPSTVVTSRLLQEADSTRQVVTGFPSSSMVQAPQSPVPQPSFEPVRSNW